MRELVEAFRALRGSPRALWLVMAAYCVSAVSYFGILGLMKPFLGEDIGIAPERASAWVSLFAGALSLVMVVVGRPIDAKLGVRSGILLALVLSSVGRAIYVGAPFAGGATAIAISLAIVALGEGILQPVAYAGVKKYTNEKNGPMGYALFYAFMNLGAGAIGPISAKVRTTYDAKHAAGLSAFTGFNAVNAVCLGFTAFALVAFVLLMTRKEEAKIVRVEEPKTDGGGLSLRGFFEPFADRRFIFFIFMLLPVRTLFAHQFLTMPEYVLRAYSKPVADNMETLVETINPAVIFFGVPLVTALTKKYNVLSMMIVGTLVSATSTFMLVPGGSVTLLIAYFVVFSIGEAFWSSRFYEYAAELAPAGRTAQYMGIAVLPWFLAKSTTGFYSGWVLERFCPKEGPQDAGTMWLLYGLVALVTPAGLVLARRWLAPGMTGRVPAAA